MSTSVLINNANRKINYEKSRVGGARKENPGSQLFFFSQFRIFLLIILRFQKKNTSNGGGFMWDGSPSQRFDTVTAEMGEGRSARQKKREFLV